jgi:hypothetical protein
MAQGSWRRPTGTTRVQPLVEFLAPLEAERSQLVVR